MRLTEQRKEWIVAAASRHVHDAAVTRLPGQEGRVIVVGHDIDDPTRWAGLVAHKVEDDGTVWWCDAIYLQRRRSDVVEHLRTA